MKDLPVYERFHTFQGEGVWMGYPAFFIRLHGCPIACPFCDSAGTWHPEYVPKIPKDMMMSPVLLAEEIKEAGVEMVVITGGEPAIHDLTELSQAIRERVPGARIHIETSGAFPIRGIVHWITLSPKRWKEPLPENVWKASEFKIIVEKAEDIEFYYEMLKACNKKADPQLNLSIPDIRSIWLHPEWGQKNNADLLLAISNAVKNGGGRYRAGYQLHKLYRVDAADYRSRSLVPLGGNPKRGY